MDQRLILIGIHNIVFSTYCEICNIVFSSYCKIWMWNSNKNRNNAMSATSNPRTQESVSKMVSLVGKRVVRFPNPLALGSK